jgi:Oxidoreductase family, NAD-binding Rossmann fold/Oxidoreductase family, C-terminal alpha/beta domain
MGRMTRRVFGSLSTGLMGSGILAAQPSGRIRMGFIGVGGMGVNRLKGFMRHPDVDVAALCDLDAARLKAAAEVVTQANRPSPMMTSEYRRILESKDVDAVCIATPDHWHAMPMVEAARAGKDVFVEKPLSYSIGEGRAMVNAARKYGRVTQMGNHIHNDLPNYRRVVELVRSGILGKLRHVNVWKTSETKGIQSNGETAAPAGFDYETWQGPAPRRPYRSARSHFNYRFFWDVHRLLVPHHGHRLLGFGLTSTKDGFGNGSQGARGG